MNNFYFKILSSFLGSLQEIGCGEIESLLKAAEIILFFLKKSSPPCRIPKSGRKSGLQGGQTAQKRLDNTVKPCLKIGWRNIGWRNRQFSAIQQKKTVTFFHHSLMEVTGRFELPNEGFADPCLTTWPRHHNKQKAGVNRFLAVCLERPTRLELATSTLARWRSTR